MKKLFSKRSSMDILETIVAFKRKEVAERKRSQPDPVWRDIDSIHMQYRQSMVENLLADDSTGIIAEFKRKSPSKGWFKSESCAIEPIIKAYDAGGAAGISVLTDHEFFGGSPEDLINARKSTGVPLLRKDFIIDPWQVEESADMGADVILLIASCLTPKEVKQLAGLANGLAMEVLLELHDEYELDHICEEVDMVGINNRNLKTFEVNIDTSLSLVSRLPAGKPAIAESGINDIETIVTLKNAGFRGFLIGETFMKQPETAIAFADFVKKLKSKSS
jgi:indole-3-glycerol phosphate synthase